MTDLSQALNIQGSVIRLRNLSRVFSGKPALADIQLNVPKGGVFGLVGVNGAGKTTLIKHVLGLLRAKQGSVEVFGMDPVANPERVLARIGYMSEVTELPEWMNVAELIRYTQAFYSTWDTDYCDHLIQIFEIEMAKKVRTLSKGQKARVALLLALSHKPELLILDEPSSGLDPLVRRDILRTVIQTVADEGRTVVFSSHLLEEVERVADYVAIIDQGKIVAQGELDDLKLQYQHLSIAFHHERNTPPLIEGAIAWKGSGKTWSGIFHGELSSLTTNLSEHSADLIQHNNPNLDQLFFALVGEKHQTTGSQTSRPTV